MPYELEKGMDDKQEAILSYIKEYQATSGHAPSASDIVLETGIGPSVVNDYLEKLEHAGFIEQNRFGIKLITPVQQNIPSIADRKLRVFLCHASQDKPVVRELYQKLLAEGWIDPWLDKEKLLPGQDWELEIEKSVEKADVVIVCLSKSSVEKEGYYQKEIKKVLDVADEKPESTIFIVPLRLDNCQPSRRLLKWQYEDYFPATNRNEAYARLLQSLTSRAKSLGIELKQSVLDSIQAIPVLINYPPSMESENVLGKLVHDVVFHDSTTDCMTVIKHALEQTASPLFFPRLFVLSDNKRNAIHLFEGGGELGEPVSFVRGTIEVIPYPGNLSKVCVYSDSLEDDRDKWMLDRWSAIRVKLENDGWRFTNARNFA